MHALGIYHEQSRTDRDDYVEIVYDKINPGWTYTYTYARTIPDMCDAYKTTFGIMILLHKHCGEQQDNLGLADLMMQRVMGFWCLGAQ